MKKPLFLLLSFTSLVSCAFAMEIEAPEENPSTIRQQTPLTANQRVTLVEGIVRLRLNEKEKRYSLQTLSEVSDVDLKIRATLLSVYLGEALSGENTVGVALTLPKITSFLKLPTEDLETKINSIQPYLKTRFRGMYYTSAGFWVASCLLEMSVEQLTSIEQNPSSSGGKR